MRLFIIILVSVLLGSILYFIFRGKFNIKNRIIISLFSIIIFIIIGIYTFMQDADNKKDADIIASFSRGEEIKCGDLIVSQKDFIFISGTLSFVGKKDTDSFGKIIQIDKCY